jgi:hypothetical protein
MKIATSPSSTGNPGQPRDLRCAPPPNKSKPQPTFPTTNHLFNNSNPCSLLTELVLSHKSLKKHLSGKHHSPEQFAKPSELWYS